MKQFQSMRRLDLAIFALSAMSLLTSCGVESPVACLTFEASSDQDLALRDFGASIADEYEMEFSDASDKYPFNERRSVYYQLTGGGMIGSSTSKLLGAPLIGEFLLASHFEDSDATVCFYGNRESELLQELIDEFSNLVESWGVRYEVDYR